MQLPDTWPSTVPCIPPHHSSSCDPLPPSPVSCPLHVSLIHSTTSFKVWVSLLTTVVLGDNTINRCVFIIVWSEKRTLIQELGYPFAMNSLLLCMQYFGFFSMSRHGALASLPLPQKVNSLGEPFFACKLAKNHGNRNATCTAQRIFILLQLGLASLWYNFFLLSFYLPLGRFHYGWDGGEDKLRTWQKYFHNVPAVLIGPFLLALVQLPFLR